MKNICLIFTLIITFAAATEAGTNRFNTRDTEPFTTWFPQDFECPIDKQKNTFMVIGSYGSYIYSWPSKYQWLFFPYTDSPAYYTCKKCHLTTYMWDFDKLPKDKLPLIEKVLSGVKVSKTFKEYTELSVVERLEIMEKVYALLDKDDEWWERFHRVKGYHYGSGEKADSERKKSLDIIGKMLTDETAKTPKKLLLYMSAAMKHFTRDDTGALSDLQKALDTKYLERGADEKDIAAAEDGLNERIKDYIERIKKPKSPREVFGTDDDH